MVKKRKIELSVVVPCYNEEKNIPLVVEQFNKIKPKDCSVELVLVNNGSTDGSSKILDKFSKKYKDIKVVLVKKNIGYGFGVYSGLIKASGDYLCWTHADMQTDLKDAITAFDIIKNQNDPKRCFVKGLRRGRPLFDVFFTSGMSIFESIILGRPLRDINSQPNLFHRSFFNGVKTPPLDFSFDLYYYYIAKKKGYKVIRFPVLFPKRIHGESHWNTNFKNKLKFIKRTVQFTFKLKKTL